jgi:TetR/AcrR family transcriptional repressor of nem operon
MKDAGLTQGGFYKHFRSREDLVAQALTLAFKSSEAPKSYGVADAGDLTFKTFVEAYLSGAQRDDRGSGCAVGALVSDLGRGSEEVKALHTRQVKRNLEGLIRRMGKDGQRGDRSEAILAFCAMVGAIGLSRAVSDPDLSEDLLVTVRRLLIERQAARSTGTDA